MFIWNTPELPPAREAGDAPTSLCGSHASRFPGCQLVLEGGPNWR